MRLVALLLGVLCELNPGVLVLIAHQLDVLWNECAACYWNSLIPCFVVNLGESVGMADELTGGPLGKLAVVPREVSR